jgi:hypothetical protein
MLCACLSGVATTRRRNEIARNFWMPLPCGMRRPLSPVPEAHLDTPGAERMADLLQAADEVLLPAMNAKEALASLPSC